MKKHLMLTTALCAAGLALASGSAFAQDKKGVSISLGGFMSQKIGFAENDDAVDDARVDVDQVNDGEIFFELNSKLDNGIEIVGQVQLESFTDGDQIDEAYALVRGSFGQLQLGSEDVVAHQMTTGYLGSWGTQVGENVSLDTQIWVPRPGQGGAGTGGTAPAGSFIIDTRNGPGICNDCENVSYYTPRFAGFQLGASYIPAADQDNNASLATVASQAHEGYSFGANFDQKFGEIGVAVAAGYTTANGGSGTAGNPDPELWNIAGAVTFGAFRVAASYLNQNDFGATDGHIWDVGARYRMGANAFSIAYMQGAVEGTTAIDDENETKKAVLSYNRTLGPGVNWYVSGIWADWEGEASGSADDNDGYAIVTAIALSF